MFSENKIEIYEDQDSLSLQLKWFSPIAYFFLLFTIVWNGFLVFWYAMVAASGAPLVFQLFPILHIAVGLFMLYYTLCLFSNKTYMDIKDGYLNVSHQPIPWWKGNKELLTDQIEQLYVKQQNTKSNNGSQQYSYALRAKLKDSSDETLISFTGISSTRLQEIEERLERFIGIADSPVKGEYGAHQKRQQGTTARQQRRTFSSDPIQTCYQRQENDYINLVEEGELYIAAISQYDWHDGNTDKLFQLINTDQKERLIYFQQNLALLNAYLEENLNLASAGLLHFSTKDLATILVHNGKTYQLDQLKKGNSFRSKLNQAIPIEQWVYRTTDGAEYLRVTNHQQQIKAYHGVKIQAAQFNLGLDLNQNPQKEIDYERPTWNEDDLV